MTPKIEIRNKKYDAPSIDRLKKKQVQKLQKLLPRLTSGQDIIVAWDMVGILVPKLPTDVLDDLTVGECKRILADADIVTLPEDKEKAVETDITVGESSASTE